MRSVWSREGAGSVTSVVPLPRSPARMIADLIWAEATGVAAGDALQFSPGDRQREEVPLLPALDRSPHELQGIDDSPHGPPPQIAVTAEDGEKGMGCEHARHEADAGPGVAEIEDVGGLLPSPRPHAAQGVRFIPPSA